MTTLLSRPELGPNTLSPRPYQLDAIEAARNELGRNRRRSTLMILPTGTGKTVTFAVAARSCVDRGGRVLVLAHRKELIHQAANVMERAGLHPTIELAGEHARACFDPDVVIASVQSIGGEKRLKTWPRDYFRLIVVDEAHHSTASSYQRILSHFRTAKLLGVTATPDRADDDEIAEVYESVAYEMTIWDAMTAPPPGPYLCPITVVKCSERIDLRGIRTTGSGLKDFSNEELAEIIKPMVETLANAVKPKIAGRHALIFTPDCGSASAMATALQSLDVEARYVAGDSPDRDELIRGYQAGRIPVLVNAMLLTEGFDAPKTDAIVPLRPTKSRPLYAQIVGRGTRLAPGKTDCRLIDFAWLTDSHDLTRPADLFDRSGRPDDEAAVLAELIDGADGPVDLVAASERAEKEASRRREIAVKAKARDVRLKFVTYDAAAVAGVLGVPVRGATADATHAPATARQKEAMSRFGVANVDGASKRFASKMLDVLVERARKGLATAKQTSHLIRIGVEPAEARAMTLREASERLDAAWGKRA